MRHITKGTAASLTAATGAVCLGLGLATLACSSTPAGEAATASAEGLKVAALEQVTGFGSNPGGLDMYRYVPSGVGANAPLVLVLHGCTQTAADMVNAGFDALADAYKFHVVYPEQQTANNIARCFNWFDSANEARGQGENLSIKQMVDKMKTDFSVDASKVFIVGFSSGGAEAALMLATYPDVFAAGATFSGIPFACATDVTGSSACIKPGKDQTAKAWGDLVRAANPSYAGKWPRLSIWQGTADGTVDPSNTTALMRQWTDVSGASQTPTSTDTAFGYPHATYAAGGVAVVETFAITGKDHGFFVDPAGGCGTAASYFIDASICGASHALAFFGVAPADGTDGGVEGGSGDDGGDGGGSEGGEGGAPKDAGPDTAHDATPGNGGYGGSSGSSGSSGASSGSSGASSGGADSGAAAAPDDSGGVAGCAVGSSRAPARDLGFGFGALLGLAALRRRSRKTK
jgi:poly(hydroxyalkanoate) depolymerase family esterase